MILDIIKSHAKITEGEYLEWGIPRPLISHLSEDHPYPIDSLPFILKEAVKNYQSYGKQPMPLVACGALANVSLACQSLANVARDNYLISPISLYFLVIANSGERKSAADNVFSRAIRKWEFKIRSERDPQVQTALTLHKAWQMERDGILQQIRRSMTTGIDTDFYRDLLERIMFLEPDIPPLPTLYFEDATQEALSMQLAQGWPSAALWSDEAGIVLGSQSMKSNPTRFVALLNRLWDGKTLTVHRKTSKSFQLAHRRLTVNLMMQPFLLHQTTRQMGIHRQSGFLARCLLAYPESSMGERFYQEPPLNHVNLNAYESQLTACLEESKYLNRQGCINLPVLTLSPSAKKVWVHFFNNLEQGLSQQGQWRGIKDFASKASENVARLSGLFHLFESKLGNIEAESVEQAIEIIAWHLEETRQLFQEESLSENMKDAKKLWEWLKNKGYSKITPREVQQRSPLRNKTKRDNALEVLIGHQLIRVQQENNKSILELNPYSS